VIRPQAPYGTALGFLELRSIARGIVVCDALVKKAPVRILFAEPVSPGKYLVLFDGGEAEVEEAFRAGLETARDGLVDSLMLSQPHEALWKGLDATLERPELDSICVVESHSVAGTMKAADRALKAAEVTLFQMQLAKGIGGKGWFALSGVLDQVESATEAATSALGDGLLAGVELIARPHEELSGPVL
jgi:microcompartment protein CcmL/EutN